MASGSGRSSSNPRSSAPRWSRIRSVWFLTRDGKLHVRARSDGAERDRMALGILPSGGLLMAGKQALVAAGRGTIRPVAAVPAGRNRSVNQARERLLP